MYCIFVYQYLYILLYLYFFIILLYSKYNYHHIWYVMCSTKRTPNFHFVVQHSVQRQILSLIP